MANILRKSFLLRSGLLILLLWLTGLGAHATHLRAGDIVAVRDNCNSTTFLITITVYTNTNGTSVLFGGTKFEDGDILDFGDGDLRPGRGRILVPEIGPGKTPSGSVGGLAFSSTYTEIDAAHGIARATYTVTYTYAGPDSYVISYREPNRNGGVLNMDNSRETPFYLETQVVIDPFLGCSNTPNLLVPPIDRACSGVAWFHNPGAYDPDEEDSLSYAMVVPFQDVKEEVLNYLQPNTNNSKLYSDFSTANELNSGPPTFKIDAVSGTITWDAPGNVGEYNIAFEIREWRLIEGQWLQIGFVRRDMQIVVEDCDNDRPDLEIPNDTCVVAESGLKATIVGFDPDNDKFKIEAFSEIFNFPAAQSPATYIINSKGELEFEWNTKCSHVKDQPYQVVFKISDQPSNGSPSLATFKTWFIKVVGPAPEWEDATLDLSTRQTKLKWSRYFCQSAEKMQVWRRVGEFPFEPDNCQTGMPEFLGYELIETVPIKTGNTPVTTFTDTNKGKGLAPGAQYCYRLVAVFPLPRGGESYVSKDTCVGPILADVPVITNVSVVKTNTSAGEILVRWQKPFDADTVQFRPPYRYEIYRATGFARGSDSTNVTSVGVFVNDTTFIDKGLNTEEFVYNYSITGYSSTNGLLGTSAAASSVRLETKSEVKKIELNWSAFVPWSNQIPKDPRYPTNHVIYRGSEGDAVEDLDSIATVDVTTNGFTYIDEGQHNGVPLVDNQIYCYRIKTRGGYGNPKIITPLENFSQRICAQPGDSIPPCQLLPPLRVDPGFTDCNDYRTKDEQCDRKTFTNTIFWNRPTDTECRGDISSYNVYAASKVGDDLTFVKNVKDTFYTDGNLLSFARCYKISAVDRSGNEGELSDILCIDNCPYYELPNVFTPNGDKRNDLFSAYSGRSFLPCPEVGCIPIQVVDDISEKCARFVLRVNAKIYNRWGKEVYTYEGQISDEIKNIYIDWNGIDNNGNELASAVYYYVADVTFDSVDPAQQVKTFKGWVHLLR